MNNGLAYYLANLLSLLKEVITTYNNEEGQDQHITVLESDAETPHDLFGFSP